MMSLEIGTSCLCTLSAILQISQQILRKTILPCHRKNDASLKPITPNSSLLPNLLQSYRTFPKQPIKLPPKNNRELIVTILKSPLICVCLPAKISKFLRISIRLWTMSRNNLHRFADIQSLGSVGIATGN